MKKSNEKAKRLEELPKVDYTKLPEGIEKAITREPYKIEEKVKLTWDTRQFLVRIPSEIAREYGITEENKDQFRVIFRLTKPLPDSKDKPKLEIEWHEQ